MESTELRNEADSPQPSHPFDVFLSYSRRDTAFAVRLENALESYRFPRSLKSVKRSLNVFRDESDITASDDYHRTIEQDLKGSAKLVVICSPDARQSQYVEDEIRRFIETHGEQDIIPVLFRGKANNETTDETEKAFPEVLCGENRMPLAANFVGCDTYAGKLDKGPFRSSFYSILAAIHGIDRRRLEQIDEKVRARRRALALSIASVIILVLSVSLVYAVISQRKAVAATKEAETAKDKALASAKAEEIAKDKALASAEAEETAKNKALASARAEEKAKNEALAAAEAEKKAKDEAVAAAKAEEKAKNEAIAQKQAAERLLYASNLNLAPQAYATGNVKRSVQLIESHSPAKPADEDMRGFEWYYLNGRYHRELGGFAALTTDVNYATFSPDGKLLATATGETIKLWDAASRKLLTEFKSEDANFSRAPAGSPDAAGGSIATLAFSPNNRVLAIAGRHGVKLWDTANQKSIAPLEDPFDSSGARPSMAFASDGERLMLAAGYKQTYKLWDVAARKLIAKFAPDKNTAEDPANSESAVAFSHDGKTLAYIQGDVIQVRDIAAQRIFRPVDATRSGSVLAITFSADNQMVRIGTLVGVESFSLKDDSSNNFLVPSSVMGDLVVAFSPDGLTFATGHSSEFADGVELWDISSHERLATFVGLGSHGGVASLNFSPDSKTLVVGAGKSVQLNDARLHYNSVVIRAGSQIPFAAFTGDSKRFVVTEKTEVGAQLTLWDVASTESLAAFPIWESGDVAALSPDGKTLAIKNESGVALWDVAAHKITTTIPVSVDSLAFSPDGLVLAMAIGTSQIQWWDISRGELSGQLSRGANASTLGLAFSPDGKFLAALVKEDAAGSHVDIWDTASRQNQAGITFSDQLPQPSALAFSADGKVLALGLENGAAQLWDVSFLAKAKKVKSQLRDNGSDPIFRKKFLMATLEGHSKPIKALAWSSDNKTLATGSEDGTVKLWSRSSYQQLLELPGELEEIWSLAFSPDKETLLAGGHRGIHLWYAPRTSDKAAAFVDKANSPRAVSSQLSLFLTGKASSWFNLLDHRPR